MDQASIEAKIKIHFNPEQSTVNLQKQAMMDALGFTLSSVALAGIVGAPTGSVIEMKYTDGFTEPPGTHDPDEKIEEIPAGLLVTIKNDNYIAGYNQVCLYNVDDISRGIYVKLIRFKKNQKISGFGALMLKSMLNAAATLPIDRRLFSTMEMLAAGGRHWGDMDDGGNRWAGYAVWPKYGFDMPLHPKTGEILNQFPQWPKNLADCKTVSSVLALPGGPRFWEMVGDGWIMNFDMTAGSANCKALDRYLSEV